MKLCDLDDSTLEGQILYNLNKVSLNLTKAEDVQIMLERDRVRLRNYINIYKQKKSYEQLDDLVAAIIADNVLPQTEIQFAFDLNITKWTECIKRINARNETKQ
jgi:hypothetical protein